jgi:hypothetical protein
MNFNVLALGIFSALILLIGVADFLLPEYLTILSATYICNLFRINLGLIGIIIALFNHIKLSRHSNFVFGMLLTYLAVASFFHLFPEEFFQWTVLDDILNMDIGLAMVLISLIDLD